ncbi:MAG: Hpt domain-containing protein, partial [Thauera sp.]|nr:Hpt domain-containing protein [Thauera sp.]
MSDFSGMEDLLQDFLVEATDLLSGVDNKLVELEKNPHDRGLLNDIFRGFHTIKGGAGFLNATELVTLCHLTENLFDKLRTGELDITAEAMDVIMAATATVRDMFDALEKGTQPRAADGGLIASLKQAIAGELKGAEPKVSPPETAAAAAPAPRATAGVVDWNAYYAAVTGKAPEVPAQAGRGIPQPPKPDEEIIKAAIGRRASDKPGYGGPTGRRESEKVRDNSIRVDTARLDQVLNLSGEIGLTKNRLTSLRTEILAGLTGPETLQALDAAVGQLDLLVSDLQNAVMKTRMQPIGRLFQKYPRIARDLARNLGKDVELVLAGEETEIDKTMIEDLSDP